MSSYVVLRLLGLEVGTLEEGQPSMRWALAVMFMFTGVGHFGSRRASFIETVPPRLPSRALLVTVTGVLGLLLAPTYRLAAGCLAVLLIFLFPASIHAARSVEPWAISTQNRACLSISSFFDHTYNTSQQKGVATTD